MTDLKPNVEDEAFFWMKTTKEKTLQTLVLGRRPVANIMCEKPSTVPLLVFRDSKPSVDFEMACGDSSV